MRFTYTASSLNAITNWVSIHVLFHDERSRLKNEIANLDQQGGRSKYIGGSGKIHPSRFSITSNYRTRNDLFVPKSECE